MEHLTILVGLMFATIIMVAVGEKLKLPYPVLMVLAFTAIAFIPGFPYVEIPTELILPLFLPPLLYATAMKTSWSVFRIRWRSIILLAVALVFLTVAITAGMMWLLVPSIGIPAAIALGAMVSPPDPVAVESIASKVHMPRRLVSVLQSEGLFNDAAAIVIFQTAVAATVSGKQVTGEVFTKFLLGAVIAIAIGLLMGYLTKQLTKITKNSPARSAITLVAPFAVYLGAEHFHASGVIAVVVLALEMRRNTRPQDAEERITTHSFWEVVELMATGIAFGLMGLEFRHVVQVEGNDIWSMLVPAVIICAVVILVRVLWLGALMLGGKVTKSGSPPSTVKELIVLSWSGMRGLATLALALALPQTLADGAPFPHRDLIIVTACAVIFATLILPGLTLPLLMKVLKMGESPTVERQEMQVIAQRAHEAAMSEVANAPVLKNLTEEEREAVRARLKHLSLQLSKDSEPMDDDGEHHKMNTHDIIVMAQTIALDAAREELVAMGAESGIDPHALSKVMRRVDMRSMVIKD
ncbi:MAG: Na+/H+ antiporter [Enterococcus sp.]|nr:Na+/H+ antiporter [Enterococcus sp.]